MTPLVADRPPLDQRPLWQEVVAVVAYPASLLLAIAAFLAASAHGYPKSVSAYLPAIVCGAAIFLVLERLMPYRSDWRPDAADWLTDASYVLLIQVAMPPLLALAAVFGLSSLAHPHLHSSLWPHQWPLIAQGVLMVLLVDLTRYWLHRFAHTNPVLWRLHAVHHSPNKLYCLNTARFHPLEKVLHFVCDSVPFIVLGVHENVLAFYFVCYAVNGFYQHSNVYLRLGPLNYVFSTPELHRWHHSKILKEANHNYSNTTIVWDIVFGTYFRPRNRRLDRTGIENDHYPMSLGRQLLAPFVRQVERRDRFVPTLRQAAVNALLALGFAALGRAAWRRIGIAAGAVADVQVRVLRNILWQNRNTAFGEQHQFAEIAGVDDFRRHCPVQTYDSLWPYIKAQDENGSKALTIEQPLFYAKTSGTTGAAKLIPVTPAALAQIRRQQALAAYLQYRACPHAFHGALLAIGGAAVEGRTASHKPVGAISGLMYRMLPWPMKRKFILPAEVFGIKDNLSKYLAILRLSLAEKGVTYIASPNPSTFVVLLDLARGHRDELLNSIETGTWPPHRPLPPEVAGLVEGRLRPDPGRAAELRALFAAKERPGLGDYWPYVELVATWTSGNCRIPLHAIRASLPAGAAVMDLGFLASECRLTATLEAATASGLPLFQDHFFEFVERAMWDDRQAVFLTLDQLELGREYYLFVTTMGGLYRYDMNDIVRVTGHHSRVPLIEFLQKGRGVTNITGEKLYETQVTQAIASIIEQCSVTIPFFIALADRSAGHYLFCLEVSGSVSPDLGKLAGKLDEQLGQQNDEFREKRASGRLRPTRVCALKPGAVARFRAHLVQRGQKEGQLKVPCLAYRDELDFDFSNEVVER